jgi:hypothetical protein
MRRSARAAAQPPAAAEWRLEDVTWDAVAMVRAFDAAAAVRWWPVCIV